MATTPPPTDSQRIRRGLIVLGKQNKAVINAAILLEKIEGDPNPPGITQLLKRYTLTVGNVSFHGLMTQEQHAYLQGYLGTLKQLADAISKLMITIYGRLVNISQLFDVALDPPSTRRPGHSHHFQGVSPPVTPGCCTYDSGLTTQVSQSFCQTGLLGNWVAGDCPPRDGGKKNDA